MPPQIPLKVTSFTVFFNPRLPPHHLLATTRVAMPPLSLELSLSLSLTLSLSLSFISLSSPTCFSNTVRVKPNIYLFPLLPQLYLCVNCRPPIILIFSLRFSHLVYVFLASPLASLGLPLPPLHPT